MARPHKWTPAEVMRVRVLLSNGLTVREIAEKTGIPKSTVHWMGKQASASPTAE